ncbi:MAG: hypothetical protein RIR52_1165 [Acidobacteriota bacterium]|jgi:probable rRNA maturation factor
MMSTTVKSASDSGNSRKTKQDTAGRTDAASPVEVINRQRSHQIDRQRVAGLAQSVLDAINEPAASLSIIFVRDRRMRELNRQWRGMDRPTDVLSFAYHENDEENGPLAMGDECQHLGDVVISVETAERYAAKYGISFGREIDQLIIHGTLHLAGYDHETDEGQMNRLEKRLRRKLLPEDGEAGSHSAGPRREQKA